MQHELESLSGFELDFLSLNSLLNLGDPWRFPEGPIMSHLLLTREPPFSTPAKWTVASTGEPEPGATPFGAKSRGFRLSEKRKPFSYPRFSKHRTIFISGF